MAFPSRFTSPWKQHLLSQNPQQANDFPLQDVDSLVTTSSPQALYLGTGYSIFKRALIPAILSARHSIHFVTCYWAPSPSLTALGDALEQLAASRPPNAPHRLRVTIGFSSSGLFQKLLHTGSRDGHVYTPDKWAAMGLPDPAKLEEAGIDLTVKSLFFTPLSVMHPKYVLIDRTSAFIPSCNVSWERWFEGCVEVQGGVVGTLLDFHERVWGGTVKHRDGLELAERVSNGRAEEVMAHTDDDAPTRSVDWMGEETVPTIFLPSSHHRNPRFSIFPFLSQTNPPPTPLNAALLTLFANAQQSIKLVTPNVTSWPAVDALLDALSRGVDVQIRTSKDMMVIEQLVTAGITTSWCLRKLVKRYEAMAGARTDDVEAQAVLPGKLEILYYLPMDTRRTRDDEPVLSHFKMTFVDGEYLVLGSGNMDRASWWTSQEIGLLFHVPDFTGHSTWEDVLEKRSEVYYRSG